MNVIQKQVDEFLDLQSTGHAKSFIQNVRQELYEYRKQIHKIEFLQRVQYKIKLDLDEHNKVCPYKQAGEPCSNEDNYEAILFFLQNEIDEVDELLEPTDFTIEDKKRTDEALQEIISNTQNLIGISQFTYDDLIAEIQELKELYFLPKKNWVQLLTGKITEMVAGGIISETISKQLVGVINKTYPMFFKE